MFGNRCFLNFKDYRWLKYVAVSSVTLAHIGCAHRTSNQENAKQNTLVSEPLAGDRYDRLALYLHQIPEANPATGGNGPYFCAYMIATNQVKLEGPADLVKNALLEHREQKVSLTEEGVKSNATYNIYPINITSTLKYHYGFNQEMFRQGMKAALTESKNSRFAGVSKLITGTARTLFVDVPGSLFTVVAKRQTSFASTQSGDYLAGKVADVTELKRTCRIREYLEEGYKKVSEEMSSKAVARIGREVETDLAVFDAIGLGIKAIKETDETKKRALCPETYNDLLAAFNRFDSGC
jgi:hypothetical protein